MKRLLGATFAAALLFPTSANAAELLKNLQISGELDVNANSAANVTDFSTAHYDGISSVQSRLMLHGDWDVNDDVHARVSIDKNDRTWGSPAQNLNTVQSNLLVDEANVKLKQLFGAVDATVGRQYFGEPGDMVIYFGPRDDLYGLAITALDAARFDWSSAGGGVGVTLLGSRQLQIGALTPPDTDSTSLYGAKAALKANENLSGSVYLYDRDRINSGSGNVLPDQILYVLGARGKLQAGGAWVKAEIDKNFGQDRPAVGGVLQPTQDTLSGWAFRIDAGAKQDLSAGALQEFVSLAGSSGGPDTDKWFIPIASDYRPGDIWGRFLVPTLTVPGLQPLGAGGGLTTGDSGSIGGLEILGAGVKVTPAALSKLTAGVSFYRYRWHDGDAAIAYAQGGGLPKPNGNTLLGEEYDLDVNWQQNENTSITVGVGDFQPGGWIKSVQLGPDTSPARLAYADLKLKFGGSN